MLTWDSDPVISGLERVVLFPPGTPGVPWNGFVSFEEQTSGGSTTLYFDGKPFFVAVEEGGFAASIEAITYPSIFETLEVFPHLPFGLSWRENLDDTYQIHLVWDVVATPSGKLSQTRSSEVNLSTFTWDILSRDQSAEGFAPFAHAVLIPEEAPPNALAAIEQALYGTATTESFLPSPADILGIFAEYPHVKVIDNGDGTVTLVNDEDHIRYLGNDLYEVESEAITFIGDDKFTIRSW